jgi:hypothetical protein
MIKRTHFINEYFKMINLIYIIIWIVWYQFKVMVQAVPYNNVREIFN